MKDLKGSTERINSNFELDGLDIYGEDGQTIADITELDRKEVLEILDKKRVP